MADPLFIMCARGIRGDKFNNEPEQNSANKLRFLKVPDEPGRVPLPIDEVKNPKAWAEEVRDIADGRKDNRQDKGGDVCIFIHGYNNSPETIVARHRILTADLRAAEFNGLVISFDWPCANSTLNYYEDRSDAAKTAKLLVDRGIALLAEGQAQGCVTNIHLLGHSTGAYVIAEAFAQSDKVGALFKRDWRVDQIGLIAGDISARSLGLDDPMTSVFDRCVRLTNYSNGHDYVLAISNAKRLGASPRAGRVGAPRPSHPKVVNVDCTKFFEGLDPKQEKFEGTFAHSWHIGNRTWTLDWAMTMIGGSDRAAIPTRNRAADGGLELQKGDWPDQWDHWSMERNG